MRVNISRVGAHMQMKRVVYMRITTADSCIPGSSVHPSSFIYSDRSTGGTRSVLVANGQIHANFVPVTRAACDDAENPSPK